MLQAEILIIERDLSGEEYEALLGLTAPEKRARIARFHRRADACRSLLADALTRVHIGERLGVHAKTVAFIHGACGKPAVASSTDAHFNVSHSGRCVVCALDSAPVGVDVEEHCSADLRIADRFFAPGERAYLRAQPKRERDAAFYKVWTMKEAYVKWEGSGLGIPLPSFDVFAPPPGICFHPIALTAASCHICTTQCLPPAARTWTIDMLMESLREDSPYNAEYSRSIQAAGRRDF